MTDFDFLLVITVPTLSLRWAFCDTAKRLFVDRQRDHATVAFVSTVQCDSTAAFRVILNPRVRPFVVCSQHVRTYKTGMKGPRNVSLCFIFCRHIRHPVSLFSESMVLSLCHLAWQQAGHYAHPRYLVSGVAKHELLSWKRLCALNVSSSH